MLGLYRYLDFFPEGEYVAWIGVWILLYSIQTRITRIHKKSGQLLGMMMPESWTCLKIPSVLPNNFLLNEKLGLNFKFPIFQPSESEKWNNFIKKGITVPQHLFLATNLRIVCWQLISHCLEIGSEVFFLAFVDGLIKTFLEPRINRF